MAWALQGVVNASVMILLIISMGYGLAHRRLFTDRFLPQVNAFLLAVGFPCLNINLLGIKLDLRQGSAWKALAAYEMWVSIIQVGVALWVRLFRRGDVGEAAVLNLLLTANNTIIIGIPIMEATFGSTGRAVALLTGVVLFMQAVPFSIVLFEIERWVVNQAAAASSSRAIAAEVPPAAATMENGDAGGGAGGKQQQPGAVVITMEPEEPAAAAAAAAAAAVEAHRAAPPSDGSAAAPGAQGTCVQSAAAADAGAGNPAAGGAQAPAAASPAAAAGAAEDAPQQLSSANEGGGGEGRPAGSGSSSSSDDEDGGAGRGDGEQGGILDVPHTSRPAGLGTSSVSIAAVMLNRIRGSSGSGAGGTPPAPSATGAAGGSNEQAAAAAAPSPATQQQPQHRVSRARRHSMPAWAGAAGTRSSSRALLQLAEWQQQHPHHGPPLPPSASLRVSVAYLNHHPQPAYNPQQSQPHQAAPAPAPAPRSRSRHFMKHRGRNMAAVDIPVPAASVQLHPDTPRSHMPRRLVTASPQERERFLARAFSRVARKYGGLRAMTANFLRSQAHVWRLGGVILKNPMVWSMLVSLVISLSGLRVWLDPNSDRYVLGLGWLVGALQLCNNTTVPLSLFSNGVWMYGKTFWKGNVRKAIVVLILKMTLLPALQLACARACGLDASSAMSLLLLSVCPVASTAFVVVSQYDHGTEIVTMVTVVQTLLLVPLTLAALNIPYAAKLYDFPMDQMPLP